MLDAKIIGANIRRLRCSAGIKETQLALELDVTYGYISLIETGKKIPSVYLLVLIANFFHVGISELTDPWQSGEHVECIKENKIRNMLCYDVDVESNFDFLYLLAQRVMKGLRL